MNRIGKISWLERGWEYKMKKIVLIIAGLSFCLLFAIIKDAHSNKTDTRVITNHDLVKLKSANIILRKPMVKPKINQQTAMQNARKFLGRIPNSKEKVDAEYHLISASGSKMFSDEAINKNPALKHGMIDIPAYIVK
jgi:hypothetical protein